ncbi:MAG: glycosyltransferase family protein [Planctomycetota bacterium]
MKIGMIAPKRMAEELRAAGHEVVELPIPIGDPAVGVPRLNLNERVEYGERLHEELQSKPVELILDRNGEGIGFVRGRGGDAELKLVHEQQGLPYLSLCDQPAVKLAEGLPWSVAWNILQSATWIKVLCDPWHAEELRNFGVPNVFHRPAMFDDEADPKSPEAVPIEFPIVCLADAGLKEVMTVPPRSPMEAWIGIVAAAAGGYPGGPPFFDLYHQVYNGGPLPATGDDAEALAAKAAQYFRARQRYVGELAIRARDRFVLFLRAKLGSQFKLVGDGWKEKYGIDADPAVRGRDERRDLIRRSGITIVVPDANSESMVCGRALEVASAGGFALCYESFDIGSYLSPGTETEVFADENTLIEKIGANLDDADLRLSRASAGRERAFRDHAMRQRMDDVLALVPVPDSRERAAPLASGQRSEDGIAGPFNQVSAAIDNALAAMAGGGPAASRRNAGRVVNKHDHLLVLTNPGRTTRHYLHDMARAAARLGISVVTFEISQLWGAAKSGRSVDATWFSQRLRENNVRAVIGSGMNGVFDWPVAVEPTGRVIPFFEQLGIPHLLWWTEHPHWAFERQALRDDLQSGLMSRNCHHFVKSELAADELRDILHWPYCYGIPVAEDGDRLAPATGVKPEYDVVAILGSPPELDDSLVALMQQDDPKLHDIHAHIAKRVSAGLESIWQRYLPGSQLHAAIEFGKAWLAARTSDMRTGSYMHFKAIAQSFPEVSEAILGNYHAYFDALDVMWELGKWQRMFVLRYLARHFKFAVYGHDWSGVGIPGGGWVDHDDMPSAYGRGRIAINISQRGDEEGISHKPFQIAACGVPLMHNDVRGLSDCFAPDVEVMRFDSPIDARRKVETILGDPRRLDLMARAARERVCREHSWEQRLTQMFSRAGVELGRTSNARIVSLELPGLTPQKSMPREAVSQAG